MTRSWTPSIRNSIAVIRGSISERKAFGTMHHAIRCVIEAAVCYGLVHSTLGMRWVERQPDLQIFVGLFWRKPSFSGQRYKQPR